MKLYSLIIFILIHGTGIITQASHVLFIHHMSSYSHIVASMPLAEALLQKGHQVTYIAAVSSSSPNPNISYIVPQQLERHMKALLDEDFDVTTRLEGRMPNLLLKIDEMAIEGCEALLSDPDFKSWLNTTDPVDLIYIDNFPECGMGIAQKLNAKLAIFLPLAINPKYFDSFGIPTESSSLPTWTLNVKTPLSFADRVLNTLSPIGWRISQVAYWGSYIGLFKNELGIVELPTMDEFYHNIRLVLMNGHFLDEQRRSLPPMFVNVPGIHVRETHGQLEKKIAEFIESPDEDGNPSQGFIYVSFGTVVKAPNLPQYIREIFFNSMKAHPSIRFLWRWNGDVPTDIPSNLYLSKWFNQQDLLGHSKIRGFVSQLGRPSSQEAAYNAVPMIVFPMLGDQDYNAHAFESLGIAINFEIEDITEEKLTGGFRRILYDQTMRDRCHEVSKLYKDLPMKPIETAVWWTEYVLRHNNTDHLKPLAISQTWYERRLLDVWLFILVASIAVGTALILITRFLINLAFARIFHSGDKLKAD